MHSARQAARSQAAKAQRLLPARHHAFQALYVAICAAVVPCHDSLAFADPCPSQHVPTFGPSALTTRHADDSRSVLSADSCTSEGPSSSLKSSSTESCSALCKTSNTTTTGPMTAVLHG
jgi:hypothetical protein